MLAASAVGAGFYTTVNAAYEKAAEAKRVVDRFNENVNLDALLCDMARGLIACGNDYWLKLTLFDVADRAAVHEFTVGYDKWFQTQVNVGSANADVWQVESGFDWTQLKKVRVVCWFDGSATGSFWVDGLFFGGRRYSTMQEDAGSQNSYGLWELVEVDEELWSDAECTSRAQALLANLKDSTEHLTLRSTVINYGSTPLLPGDTVHVELPNEAVDGDFRILTVEYYVDAKTQTLETVLELGREQPLIADYVFRLKSKTDSLSRYKLART